MSSLRAIWAAAALLVCTLPSRAEEPRAVVERAIKAAGGDVDPARCPAVRATATIKAKEIPFTVSGEFQFQSPALARFDAQVDFGAEKQKAVVVFDGKKGWSGIQGMVQEIREAELGNMRAVMRLFSPDLLPGLLADKAVKWTELPAGMIEGKPTTVLRATLADKMEIDLHFDKTTGLLVSKSARLGATAMDEAVIVLSNYQEPAAAATERKLTEAGIALDGPALLGFLRKQAPDRAKAAKAAALVKQLADDDFDMREKAAEQLVALGKSAVALLERALTSPDAEVVRRARGCLDLIAKQGNDAVLFAAIHRIAYVRVEGGTAALLKMLPGANEATTRELMAALVSLSERDGKPDPVLLKALADADSTIRAAAAAVLGKDGGTYLKQPGRRVLARGLKQPMTFKLLAQGKVVAEIIVAEYQYFNAFEPKLFSKP